MIGLKHKPQNLTATRNSVDPVQLARTLSAFATLTRLMNETTHYPVDVQPGISGKWRVRKVRVGDQTIRNVIDVMHGDPESVVAPGTYTTLSYLDKKNTPVVMMSNTQLEYRTNVDFVEKARGHVLIAGLGLGMLLRPLAAKPEVLSITVVEKERDVINLVAASYADLTKVTIVHADIFKCVKARVQSLRMIHGADKFDWVMHDIWPDISHMNLTQMHVLREMYKPYAHNQVCWSEELCQRHAARLRAMRKDKRGIKCPK